MAFSATCPNPGCGQAVAVSDNDAGASVTCPKCGGAIPAAGTGSPHALLVNPGFAINLDRLAGDPRTKSLLLAGLGSLGVLACSVFLPWFSLGPLGSFLGIRAGAGIVQLLLSLGAIGFVGAAIAKNQDKLFDISIWVAGGWSALAALWRLIDVVQVAAYGVAGFGLFLSLLAALGAAGTLGFIGVQKLQKK